MLSALIYSSPAAAQHIPQGTASLTAAEAASLAKALADENSDKAKAVQEIIADADKAMKEVPEPDIKVITSGKTAKTGEKSNSTHTKKETRNAYMLGLAYAMTGRRLYLDQARRYLLAWSAVNEPEGDSIAEMKFVPMFRDYDLVRAKLSSGDRSQIDGWLRGIADAVIADQSQARAKDVARGINNHRSYALLIVGMIGSVLDEPRYIHYVVDKQGFLAHIQDNLHSFKGETAGFGYDYHQRKAVHYVAYNLQALGSLAVLLDRLRHVTGNPYHIDYNPYTVEVGGASLLKTLRGFLPYAAGEKEATHEFEGSLDVNDQKRLRSGALKTTFDRKDVVPVLESADYFFPVLKDERTGHTYDMAAIAAAIIQESKKGLSMPEKFPTPEFLVNKATSPYLTPQRYP